MIAVNSGLTGLLRGFQRGSKEVLTIHQRISVYLPFKKDNKYNGNKRFLTSVLQSLMGFLWLDQSKYGDAHVHGHV